MGNIVFCTDSKYAPYLAVLIYSILVNTKYPLKFFVLYSSLTDEAERDLKTVVSAFKDRDGRAYEIEFRKVDIKSMLDIRGLKVTPFRDSYDPYTRLFAADIFADTELDKMLYLDVDMVCKGDIEKLFTACESVKTLAGVLDTVSLSLNYKLLTPTYINSGMLYFSLDYLRRIDFSGRCIDFINQNAEDLEYPDQDVINNAIPENELVLVDQSFNEYLHSKDALKKALILHFTGPGKPWIKGLRWRQKKVYWLTYALCTKLLLKGASINGFLRKVLFHLLSISRSVVNIMLSLKELIVGKKMV